MGDGSSAVRSTQRGPRKIAGRTCGPLANGPEFPLGLREWRPLRPPRDQDGLEAVFLPEPVKAALDAAIIEAANDDP